jgi:hypothetical protein
MTRKEIRSYVISELRRLGIPQNFTDEDINIRINHAMDELAEDVGGFRGLASQTTVVNTERYKLPSELIGLDRVEFNGEVIDKVRTDAMKVFTTTAAGGSWTVSKDTGY